MEMEKKRKLGDKTADRISPLSNLNNIDCQTSAMLSNEGGFLCVYT